MLTLPRHSRELDDRAGMLVKRVRSIDRVQHVRAFQSVNIPSLYTLGYCITQCIKQTHTTHAYIYIYIYIRHLINYFPIESGHACMFNTRSVIYKVSYIYIYIYI